MQVALFYRFFYRLVGWCGGVFSFFFLLPFLCCLHFKWMNEELLLDDYNHCFCANSYVRGEWLRFCCMQTVRGMLITYFYCYSVKFVVCEQNIYANYMERAYCFCCFFPFWKRKNNKEKKNMREWKSLWNWCEGIFRTSKCRWNMCVRVTLKFLHSLIALAVFNLFQVASIWI